MLVTGADIATIMHKNIERQAKEHVPVSKLHNIIYGQSRKMHISDCDFALLNKRRKFTEKMKILKLFVNLKSKIPKASLDLRLGNGE